MKKPEFDLEDELYKSDLIREKVKDNKYAQKLYAAMCNILWYKKGQKNDWGYSWRRSGELVAGLRAFGENCLDFYCSGNEGNVDLKIEKDLLSLGWKWKLYPEEYK